MIKFHVRVPVEFHGQFTTPETLYAIKLFYENLYNIRITNITWGVMSYNQYVTLNCFLHFDNEEDASLFALKLDIDHLPKLRNE